MGLNSQNVYENHVKGKHPALHLKWSKNTLKLFSQDAFLFEANLTRKKRSNKVIIDYFLMFKYVLDFSWNKNTKAQ